VSDFGIPEIYEEEAAGELKEVYHDIKQVLKVPVVNFIFRALANYPEFLKMAWTEVRESFLTINMEKTANSIRYPQISLPIQPFHKGQFHLDPSMIHQIKKEIFIFQYVNPKLSIIASAWAESLGYRPIDGGKKVWGFISPGIEINLPKVQMVKWSEASPAVQKLYLSIMKKHHAFDIASDYRVYAKYPEFLESIWSQLKKYVGTEDYVKTQEQIKKSAIQLAHKQMPYPVTINRAQLEKDFTPADIAGIMGLVSYFQNFLPDLIIETEFIRRLTVSL